MVHTQEERKEIWDELAACCYGFMGCSVGNFGDFNVIRFMVETRNCTRISRAIRGFNNFIHDMTMIDLPLLGGVYTWGRGENNQRALRIDKFLISTE